MIYILELSVILDGMVALFTVSLSMKYRCAYLFFAFICFDFKTQNQSEQAIIPLVIAENVKMREKHMGLYSGDDFMSTMGFRVQET